MKSFLLLCIAGMLASGVWADCDACIDGRCYKKHLLAGAGGRSGAIDRRTNTLYVVNRENPVKQCNLDTGACREAAHQSNILALTVDQRTGNIYGSLDSGRGIYKFDFVNNRSVVIDPNPSVSRLVFKDKFYYSPLVNDGIFTSEGGISRPVSGTEESRATSLFIDKNDNLYYKVLYNGVNVAKSAGQVRDLGENRHVSVDKNGDAILVDYSKNTVYRVTNGRLVEVGAVKAAMSYREFLFDRDNNIIYILREKSYHLKQVSHARCEVENLFGLRSINEI